MPQSRSPEDAFAHSVTSLRQERGWSQDHLAYLMRAEGIEDATQLTVSRIENGRRKVPLSEALALARILQAPIPVLAAVGEGSREASHLARREASMTAEEDRFMAAAADYMRDVVRAAQIQISEGSAWLKKLEADPDADPEAVERIRQLLRRARPRLKRGPSYLAAEVERIATREDGLVRSEPSRLLPESDGDGERKATP